MSEALNNETTACPTAGCGKRFPLSNVASYFGYCSDECLRKDRDPEQNPFGPAAETVNHPVHYNSHPSGIECIQIVRHMSFNIGNAMKYLWRADEKGAPIEDLKKAVWYIRDEITRREEQAQGL